MGSSGVSTRQARFEGSDRQARGRLMKAIGEGPLRRSDAARLMGRDEPTTARLIADLVGEGLCRADGDLLRLPD